MRVVQGIGGAMLFANSAAILTDAFPSHQRGLALGINGVAAIAGSFIGLVLGGILAPIQWRLVFVVSVPVGVFGTVWAYRKLRRPEPAPPGAHRLVGQRHVRRRPHRDHGRDHLRHPAATAGTRWAGPRRASLAALIGGLALLVAFALIERRVAEPMFNLSLFRSARSPPVVLPSFPPPPPPRAGRASRVTAPSAAGSRVGPPRPDGAPRPSTSTRRRLPPRGGRAPCRRDRADAQEADRADDRERGARGAAEHPGLRPAGSASALHARACRPNASSPSSPQLAAAGRRRSRRSRPRRRPPRPRTRRRRRRTAQTASRTRARRSRRRPPARPRRRGRRSRRAGWRAGRSARRARRRGPALGVIAARRPRHPGGRVGARVLGRPNRPRTRAPPRNPDAVGRNSQGSPFFSPPPPPPPPRPRSGVRGTAGRRRRRSSGRSRTRSRARRGTARCRRCRPGSRALDRPALDAVGLGVRDQRAARVGEREARRDRVDADAEVARLARHRRVRATAALRGDVVRPQRRAAEAVAEATLTTPLRRLAHDGHARLRARQGPSG